MLKLLKQKEKPIISCFATTSALTTVENKMADVSNLVLKRLWHKKIKHWISKLFSISTNIGISKRLEILIIFQNEKLKDCLMKLSNLLIHLIKILLKH